MEAKHTPGPWTIEDEDVFNLGGGTRGVLSQRDEWVAHVEGWGADSLTAQVAAANAALIAAAPDMELALGDAARLVGLILAGDEAVDTADLEATYAGINAALAKAERR